MTDAAANLRARLGPVGLWTGAMDGLPVHDVIAFAGTVEDLGIGGLWFGEAYGRESFAQAGLLLDGSQDLVVGQSIASIWARDAFAARGAQATLNARHDGRFVMGLGVSHRPMVEGLRGHDYARPLAAMRAWLTALDERSPMAPDAASSRPRMIAALGPRMLELAAELADGALPYLTLPSHTAEARELVGPEAVLVVEHGAVVADLPADEARTRVRDHLEIYTGLPNYRNSWTRQGFDESDYVRGGSHRLQDALVTVGLDDTVSRVQEHLDAGADQVAVQVLGQHALDTPVDDVRALMSAMEVLR